LKQCIKDELIALDFDRAAALSLDYKLNGRDIKNICSEIKSMLFNFEKPINFYSMSPDEQMEFIKKHHNKITEQDFLDVIETYAKNKRDYDERPISIQI